MYSRKQLHLSLPFRIPVPPDTERKPPQQWVLQHQAGDGEGWVGRRPQEPSKQQETVPFSVSPPRVCDCCFTPSRVLLLFGVGGGIR